MNKPKIIVLSSGMPNGGGSGFENLVRASKNGDLDAKIIGVVSNHQDGGVKQRADRLKIPFIYFPGPWTEQEYQRLANDTEADFFACSGWLKLIKGLDLATRFNSKTVFNIHPGPLPDFGGKGLYGHHVHEAVMSAYRRGEITHTAISMHFVTEPTSQNKKDDYDKGPVFLRRRILIKEDDTAKTLGERVLENEHLYQPHFTNLVVNKEITWDGINPNTLRWPSWHTIDALA